MNTPYLQVALDVQHTNDAINLVKKIETAIDVIEAGTILCVAEGVHAVRTLHTTFPHHTLLADIKMADAGGTLAKMCANAGADWVTVICCAPIPTVEAALHSMREIRGNTGDVQIELYGNWTWDEAQEWKNIGIKQVVYHRGRDAQAAGQHWGDADLEKIQRLCDMRFDVSVTGGIIKKDIYLFKGMAIKSFIAGRSLIESEHPLAAAQALRDEIAKYWTS